MTPPAAAAATSPAGPARRTRAPVPARPRVAPRRPPRRISGPLRVPAGRSARPSQAQTQAQHGLVLGVLGALDGVSRSGALDRLIRGRIWIAVIAFALIGIVTLQLLVLQLNASIGRSLVREAQLQRANAALSIEGSELSAGERVESQAGRIGMQLVPLGSLRFLTANPRGDVARAAAALKAPVHATGSGEAGATSQTAGATTAATGAPASGEQAPSGEASTGTPTQTSTPTGEAGTSGGEATAPSSEAPGSSVASTPSAPSSTAGAAAATPTEAPTAGLVGGAGGVGAGAGQPSGAG
jgi:hypothetical protein